MHALRLAIRGIAFLFGLLLLIGSLAGAAGLLSTAEDTVVPLSHHMLTALPLLLAGLALLAPHRRCLAQPRYAMLLTANLLVGAICAYRLLQTITLARHGDIDAIAIPVASIIALIPFTNAWALRSSRRADLALSDAKSSPHIVRDHIA